MAVAADRDGCDVQALRGFQVGGAVIDQEASRWVFVNGSQGDLKGFNFRLAIGMNGVDINDLFKMPLDT